MSDKNKRSRAAIMTAALTLAGGGVAVGSASAEEVEARPTVEPTAEEREGELVEQDAEDADGSGEAAAESDEAAAGRGDPVRLPTNPDRDSTVTLYGLVGDPLGR